MKQAAALEDLPMAPVCYLGSKAHWKLGTFGPITPATGSIRRPHRGPSGAKWLERLSPTPQSSDAHRSDSRPLERGCARSRVNSRQQTDHAPPYAALAGSERSSTVSPDADTPRHPPRYHADLDPTVPPRTQDATLIKLSANLAASRANAGAVRSRAVALITRPPG